MKRVVRWLLIFTGYLLYTIGVVIVLLWVLFPADSALLWLQGKLRSAYPALVWNVAGLEKDFPLQLRLSNISVYERNDQETPLFRLEEVLVSPAMDKLITLQKPVPVRYQLKTFGGTVHGEVVVPEQGSAVQCSGEIRNLELGSIEEIWKKTNRTGSGKLSGTFQYSGSWQNPLQGALQASVKVSDGAVGLQQPIFGLEQVAFHSMTTDLAFDKRNVSLDNGLVDSRLFSASYKGSIRLTDNFYTSGITLQGFMEPRPELLGGMNNPTAATLIRNQLQDKKLSFTISGTLAEPGILFKGASGIIDGVIEGGAR